MNQNQSCQVMQAMSRLVEMVTTGLVKNLTFNILFLLAKRGLVGSALHSNIIALRIFFSFCFLTFSVIDTVRSLTIQLHF